MLGLYLDIQVLGMLANNIFIENITVRTMARAIQVDHTVVAVGKLATYNASFWIWTMQLLCYSV